MNKQIGLLTAMLLFPIALVVGCNTTSPTPSSPAGSSSPVPTRTATGTPTITATPMNTATPQFGQLPVNLRSAASYVVLAYSQVTNSGPSKLCGNLGLSPGSSAGGGYSMGCGGVIEVDDTPARNAKLDLTTAYNDAAGRTTPALVAGNLGGRTLYPGLYKSTGSLEITSGDLTLDAQGNVNGVFIFQIASTLITSSGRKVILAGGAKAANVFWQVGSQCNLGTTSAFKGTIMAHTQITLNTGATLEGRALSQIEQVTMLSNTITKPAP